MFNVLLLYALFASVFTLAKAALGYAEPLFLVGARMLLAGVFMLLYQWFFQRESFVIKKEHFFRFFRLAVFNIYLTNAFEFWGLKYLTSFKTCFIYSLSPFISALFSYFIFSETLTKKKWLGMGVGFIGFIPILLNESAKENQTGGLFFLSWPELSVMMAAICSVYGWILLRQLVKENAYAPIMANGVSMFMGGLMALTHSFIVEPWDPLPVFELMPFLKYTLLLMIVSNLIAYNLYGALLKKYTATFISFAGFTTPLFTALFGWLFLGETVGLAFYESFVLVFLALLLFHQEELKQGYKKEEEVLQKV